MQFLIVCVTLFIVVEMIGVFVYIDKLKSRIEKIEVWFSCYILAQNNKTENSEQGGAKIGYDNKRNRKKG